MFSFQSSTLNILGEDVFRALNNGTKCRISDPGWGAGGPTLRCMCAFIVGGRRGSERIFWEKRETYVSLKKMLSRPMLFISTCIMIPSPTPFFLLANRKILPGAGIWGDVAHGKWVSRLRDRGQISIQFPRWCPLSELPTDTMRVCSNFAELPSLVSTHIPAPGSAEILPDQHPLLSLCPASWSPPPALWRCRAAEELTLYRAEGGGEGGLSLTTGECALALYAGSPPWTLLSPFS